MEIGLGQDRSAYFADAFFVVSVVALHSFECRFLQSQVRMHRRIGSPSRSVRLLHHSYKGVRNSKVPGGLNTKCN